MKRTNENYQKLHFKPMLGNLGLLLHIPATMALLSLLIALIFQEYFALLPLLGTGVLGLGVGQLLYRLFYNPQVIRLWDAMITAALGLVICCLLTTLPLWIISSAPQAPYPPLTQFINALFESVSGLTSTGLTMVERPSLLSHTLQWWRSFLQWVGGIGLVIFIISIVKTQRDEFSLYYAEKRRYRFHRNIRETSRLIWTIYSIYTILSTLLLTLAGMPFWDSLNHAMTGLATGGFSVSDTSIGGYSIQAQWATLIVMIIGATSFRVHFSIMREGRFDALWKNRESRLMLLIFALGTLLIALLNLMTLGESMLFNSLFECITAMGTCGFYTTSVTTFAPIVRLILIFGMFIGGPSDATTGGINLHRFQNLIGNLSLPFTVLTKKKEQKALKQIAKEPSQVTEPPTDILQPYSERRRRFHSAAVICLLWILTLFLGWILLIQFVPETGILNLLFDVTSAMSNIGLTTGVTYPDLHSAGKIVLILLMLLGRLDIIPILLCFFIPLLWIKNRIKKIL